MSQRCYVDNAYNRRVGRVGLPIGSHVISRSGSSSGGSSRSSRAGSSSSCSSAGSSTVYVRGYTRSDGTYVAPHTRSRQGAASSCSTSTADPFYYTCSEPTSTRVYVDNDYNRRLGRVGKPVGTHVVSRDGSEYYSDSPDYRRLDPVEKPTIRRENRQMENRHAVMQVRGILEGMAISDESHRRDHEYSRDYLQQQEVEERRRIRQSTNVPCLDGHASQPRSQLLIPYRELVLKQVIGRGGFGIVLAGEWHNTTIAFKRLNCSQLSNKQLKSFQKEVTILSSLNHPHTVRMFGAVAEGSCVGFVMERLQRSLFKAIFVDECKFTDDKKKNIISQTADALVYLHDDKRIAHCDVKSENILLDSNDDVKLADFGLSTVKSVTETTQSALQAGKGTPRYSAPEVLRGDLLSKSQWFPTDIYSLAIVVFEVMAEEEPFHGLRVRQLERHVGEHNLRPTSENKPIEGSVKALLDECWDRVPSNRPKAKEFQEKWRRWMDSSRTTRIHQPVTAAVHVSSQAADIDKI